MAEEVFSIAMAITVLHGIENSLNNFEFYARNIHAKFYQIWPSGLEREMIFMKKYKLIHDITIAHHEYYVLRWANRKYNFFYKHNTTLY